jgi:AcrR family transcriptional regulator
MSITRCIGRPRDKTRDVVIEKATVELLQEVGYENVTIESVAARAQVSKATIYRRWKNKAALVTDSVHHYAFGNAPTIDTGTLRGDLIEVITEKEKTMKSAEGQLISGLMSMARTDEDLSEVLSERLSGYASVAHTAIFNRAVSRGEIPKEAKRELILQLVPAVIGFRIFMTRETITRKFIENFVDDVLIPVLTYKNLSHTSK